MTKLYTDLKAWQHCRNETYFQGKSIGLLTTMGCLHAGHLSLLKRSVEENVFTILTVFVNPTQFGEAYDFEKYPQDLSRDYELACKADVDFLIKPDYQAIYPDDYQFRVGETKISQFAEGVARPGHFDGMLTVVMRLLNIVRPTRAYFGEKDYQQLQLVKGMVKAFHLPVEVIGCETVREASGLALSSRNERLNPKQRELAPEFVKLLQSNLSCDLIKKELIAKGFKVDYIEEHDGRRFGAVRLGQVRLIDNIEIKT